MIDLSETTATPRRKPALPRWTMAAALAFFLACPIFLAWYLKPWYAAQHIGEEMLALHVSPSPVRDANRSALDPARIEAFEYSFQAPWGKVDARRDLKHATFFLWDDAPMVTAYEPTRISGRNAMLATKPADAFRPALLNHGYDSMAEELKATPEQIHWWDRAGSARMAFLLGMKQIELQRGTFTYRIENDELRGFQFNDHPVAPEQIALVLFDVSGRRYELRVTSPPGFRKISQADINGIVASFQPVPHG